MPLSVGILMVKQNLMNPSDFVNKKPQMCCLLQKEAGERRNAVKGCHQAEAETGSTQVHRKWQRQNLPVALGCVEPEVKRERPMCTRHGLLLQELSLC